MYTGIIDHCAEIISIVKTEKGLRLGIKCRFTDLVAGESIAVDGICVTVINQQDNYFECDLSPETLALTTAKNFKEGHKINAERSLTLSDRLGGHFVMGHVDTTAKVVTRENHAEFLKLSFNGLKSEHMPHIVKKGSVAINGASLTINEVSEDGFAIMLIPHTQERTNLGELKVGDSVNIEFDMIARVVVKQMQTS